MIENRSPRRRRLFASLLFAALMLGASLNGAAAGAVDRTAAGGDNLLDNPELDGSLAHWTADPEVGFLDDDHDACPSGSARAQGLLNQFAYLYQSVAIPAGTDRLAYGVDFRFFDAPLAPASAGASGTISIEIDFFREPDCTDSAGNSGLLSIDSGTVGAGWHRRGDIRFVPGDAVCARLSLVWYWRGDPAWERADFDGAYLRLVPPNAFEPIFVHGFEVASGGSTCRWSSTTLAESL